MSVGHLIAFVMVLCAIGISISAGVYVAGETGADELGVFSTCGLLFLFCVFGLRKGY